MEFYAAYLVAMVALAIVMNPWFLFPAAIALVAIYQENR